MALKFICQDFDASYAEHMLELQLCIYLVEEVLL